MRYIACYPANLLSFLHRTYTELFGSYRSVVWNAIKIGTSQLWHDSRLCLCLGDIDYKWER